MILIILFLAACFLAYTNGANDNFKGVATLFGSGTTNYKRAITWATTTTFAGSIAAIFLANTLVKNFSGKGLVPDALIQTPAFAISIAIGAALTVFLATKIGMPISTTHSLVGALFGSGLVVVGSAFNFFKFTNENLFPIKREGFDREQTFCLLEKWLQECRSLARPPRLQAGVPRLHLQVDST